MMACSYLSATGQKPQPSMAGCWTPPYSLPEPEPTRMVPYVRPPAACTLMSEPALDLTTTIKPRTASSDDDT
ncbi:jg9898 [Pararge aegeria aegeria]|uniref:Jg9898 protein n=1 Tax=Pararge aegeria aegeria TaxID=348720 RepID=A0A8S4RBK1_9NEOP|nr:jg9898 [Pararge aegeria aegeria]